MTPIQASTEQTAFDHQRDIVGSRNSGVILTHKDLTSSETAYWGEKALISLMMARYYVVLHTLTISYTFSILYILVMNAKSQVICTPTYCSGKLQKWHPQRPPRKLRSSSGKTLWNAFVGWWKTLPLRVIWIMGLWNTSMMRKFQSGFMAMWIWEMIGISIRVKYLMGRQQRDKHVSYIWFLGALRNTRIPWQIEEDKFWGSSVWREWGSQG